jgi:hypothetical protein
MSQLVSPDAGGFGLKEIALQSGMYNGDPVHHTFRPFCAVKNVLEVFWGHIPDLWQA